MKKLYDLVKVLLTENPELRSSDKKLMWSVWMYEIGHDVPMISKEAFLGLKNPESIRRCRQKIQEKHPELKANKQVELFRKEIQRTKSTFVYRERL